MHKNDETIPEDLFLISPPGNKEAKDMGYFNVPKVFKDSPDELDEVYNYDDQSGFLEFPKESNFWVYGTHSRRLHLAGTEDFTKRDNGKATPISQTLGLDADASQF
jgi:hypothetical protein